MVALNNWHFHSHSPARLLSVFQFHLLPPCLQLMQQTPQIDWSLQNLAALVFVEVRYWYELLGLQHLLGDAHENLLPAIKEQKYLVTMLLTVTQCLTVTWCRLLPNNSLWQNIKYYFSFSIKDLCPVSRTKCILSKTQTDHSVWFGKQKQLTEKEPQSCELDQRCMVGLSRLTGQHIRFS